MRIHPLAMLAILTAAITAACGSAREVSSVSNHSNAWGCDQCHGYPPPPMFPQDALLTHPKGVTAPMCTVCHPATVLADGHSINATLIDDPITGPHIAHRDGQVEYIDYKTVSCDSCHALPPDTGRHVFHVTTRGMTCADCHKGYDPSSHTADDATHMNGTADVVLPNDYVVQTANAADGSWPTSECTDCHTHHPSY